MHWTPAPRLTNEASRPGVRAAGWDPKASRALESDLRRRIEGEVRFDDGSRALYAADGSNYRQVPIGVVIPRSIDDVVETVAACREHGAPVLSRGCGTSLCGQCCNVAVVIDFSKHVNQLLDIDPAAKTARVRPGLITDHLRKKAEREHGLVYGPDPATHAWNTLGGMLGNNSCGIHSVMAGRTSDNVEELEILTHDGARMRVGPTSDEELSRIVAGGGRRGEIYRGLREIRDRYADLIRERYPTNPRRVSGYNLDDLLPERGFNVARALVGSEGTCVTILEAKVRLVPSPPARSLLVLGYPDAYSAGDDVPRIMEHGPVGLEGLDRLLIGFEKKKDMHAKARELLPEGGGWLLVELGGETKEDSDGKARGIMAALEKEPHAPSMKLFDDKEAESRLWEVRESGLGATARVPGMKDTWPGWEDAAVHPENLGGYLRDFRALLHKFGYEASLYGHFGQACVHCRVDFDLRTHDGIRTYRTFIDEASDLVVRYRGTFSGEHGDGQSKAIFLPKIYGPELMEAFARFKRLWDPEWKMNPGKVIDPNPPESHLRLGMGYHPLEPRTHFQYPDDGGSFARATLRCVGVGKCRRTDNAFMCPSFLATREEKDTTRGRAHLLFEMLQDDVIRDRWKSEAVLDALDLCLGCKGCKKECPVDVDMATYKAEFLAHHWEGRIRPRVHYALGLVERWTRLAMLSPATANYFAQTWPFSAAAKWTAGVSQHRKLPPFAGRPFTRWAERNLRQEGSGKPVLLYPDFFNDHFHPETLIAAAKVLARLGYRVRVPRQKVPAIRPAIHFGMLSSAKRKLERAIQMLRPYAVEGIPIVGLEPSTVSVFREEMRSLMPHDQDGERIRRKFSLLSEFLDEEGVELPQLARNAMLHGHCHQKSVLKEEPMRNVLRKMGLQVEEPQKTCCGMAGAFGLESEHYDVSRAIGEMGLLPAVRRADPATVIVADGFSCRAQILEGAGRRALHLSELLWMAFQEGPSGPPQGAPPESRIPTEHFPRLETRTVALAFAAVVAGGLLVRHLLRR